MPDCICANENKENLLFDQTVGALQEILIDPDFTKMQNEFLDKNCDEFEDNKENKLSYTKIFKEYVELVESVLDKQLNDRVNGYSQEKFMEQLKERPEEVTGDVFDMLETMADFEEFRGLMLAHRNVKSGRGLGLELTNNCARGT
uniref:ADP-ribosylation factor-like protein 2-binding protein n=1 Tax=Lotharella globosa TaxID=91324 RepID=A0A7S3YML1_9EUKA|mmetsp:Transcript_23099/g.46341  ORF Transcript_23099/g.46341 Transcript_23099/m.46341 type:complete len:145 (-) Transcript_23099:231-665(-)